MKVAIFPGSFNPFHEGHLEIVKKAMKVFDKVIVARGINPAKPPSQGWGPVKLPSGVQYVEFTGLLVNLARNYNATAIIKGLRNGQDLEYETAQQYWSEDLGLHCPVMYFICSRETRHISSSAIRALQKFNK